MLGILLINEIRNFYQAALLLICSVLLSQAKQTLTLKHTHTHKLVG